MTYSDQMWDARRNRLSRPLHSATDASMTDSSSASSHLEASGTSRRSVGNGVGETVSTGCRGFWTGVWHKGQNAAVSSSFTPQLTQ